MKKIIIYTVLLLFLFLLFGCNINFRKNSEINKRKPPIVIVAIDSLSKNKIVVFRDGDNKIFTILNNPTTKAISYSLNVGDTIRLK